MEEKSKRIGRESLVQVRESFWNEVYELADKKIEPLVGSTFTQREWIIGVAAPGKNNVGWHMVEITVTGADFGNMNYDGEELDLMIVGEYIHPYTGEKVKTTFKPRRC